MIFIDWIAFILLQYKTRDSQEKAWKSKDFCNNAMPSEDTAILEFNQYWKYDKTSFVNMLLLLNECLTEKFDGW